MRTSGNGEGGISISPRAGIPPHDMSDSQHCLCSFMMRLLILNAVCCNALTPLIVCCIQGSPSSSSNKDLLRVFIIENLRIQTLLWVTLEVTVFQSFGGITKGKASGVRTSDIALTSLIQSKISGVALRWYVVFLFEVLTILYFTMPVVWMTISTSFDPIW